MLASELAMELNVDPGALSKRLSTYYLEKGLPKTRRLSEQVVDDMRKVDHLLKSSQAKTAREAIQRALGTYQEAVPPEVVGRLEQRLGRLETQQELLLVRLEKVQQTLDRLWSTIASKIASAEVEEEVS